MKAHTSAHTAASAADFVPPHAGLDELRAASAVCRGCHLFENAIQTVFGAGPASARALLVGEQPGDQEDRRGEPFVGPAGRLLDRALAEAGIDRADAYVTNAVKHFKFRRTGSGGRRIHQKPDRSEIEACAPWLRAELGVLDPVVMVLLGATAAQSVLGPGFRVTRQRGEVLSWPSSGPYADAAPHAAVVATIHPSAVLRSEDRDGAYAGLVADLRVAAATLRTA